MRIDRRAGLIAIVLMLVVGAIVAGVLFFRKEKSDQVNQGLTAVVSPGNGVSTCRPADGAWSRDGRLAGPCCVPPDYKIYDPSYKDCSNFATELDKTKKACLENCCKFCKSQEKNYDPSWGPMCRCACSLCCNNADDPHFSKFGTCVHYISGDPAEAETPDSAPASQDWRGWIDFKP